MRIKQKNLRKPIKDAVPNKWTFRFPSNSLYLRILRCWLQIWWWKYSQIWFSRSKLKKSFWQVFSFYLDRYWFRKKVMFTKVVADEKTYLLSYTHFCPKIIVVREKWDETKNLWKPIKDAVPNRRTFRSPSNVPYLRISMRWLQI